MSAYVIEQLISKDKAKVLEADAITALDEAEASIACRQIGPIKLPPNLQNRESVFSKKTSLVFKSIQVVRFYDKKRNVLIYLVFSDRLIEGSPKNSISTVPILNGNNS
jgi:CreA protein